VRCGKDEYVEKLPGEEANYEAACENGAGSVDAEDSIMD